MALGCRSALPAALCSPLRDSRLLHFFAFIHTTRCQSLVTRQLQPSLQSTDVSIAGSPGRLIDRKDAKQMGTSNHKLKELSKCFLKTVSSVEGMSLLGRLSLSGSQSP
ncbi:unnamed protein product [Protopolystoma xenopodis]|uniref:Uncharacterized protein n=1 Tax=Protopolystoma xenopodis TaxID=117903 RepID=A0A448WS65_9PLAT|nr:unnamed protein product [Protopolystoma xenopodis]